MKLNTELLDKLIRDKKVQTVLGNLWSRWQDEKEYEDINDYKKPLEFIEQSYGIKIVKMNKRPFGFKFTLDDYSLRIEVTSNRISVKIL